MTNQHPITPPPELVQQWLDASLQASGKETSLAYIATRAAQWGADQELDACLEWVCCETTAFAADLKAARRPKPPSLKEQAQAELKRLIALIPTEGAIAMAEPIRRAIEALPDG
jgi:hypothetical protein